MTKDETTAESEKSEAPQEAPGRRGNTWVVYRGPSEALEHGEHVMRRGEYTRVPAAVADELTANTALAGAGHVVEEVKAPPKESTE